MSSFLSKLTAALTVGIGGAFQMGILSPKTAAYIALGTAVLSAFQAPVQHSQADITVAKDAVAQTKVV